MGNCKIIPNTKYDKWTVLYRVENDKWGCTQWLCRCECGTERKVIGRNLTRNRLKQHFNEDYLYQLCKYIVNKKERKKNE